MISLLGMQIEYQRPRTITLSGDFQGIFEVYILTLTHTSELAVKTNMGSGVLAQRCFSNDFFFLA